MLTLVTAFFDLAKREQTSRRPATDYLKHGAYILSLPYPIVIFVDPEFVKSIREIRGDKPMHIIVMPFETVPKFHLKDGIQAARKVYPVHNASAIKDTGNYILLTWTKFDFVERVIAENPFQSTHFAWIDFGLTHVAKLDFADEAFLHIADPIKLLVNKWASTEELEAPDYYSLLRGYVAGGFMTGSLIFWQQFIQLFHEEITKLLAMQRAPSEEQIIPQIMQRNPNLFEVYYGDYDGILSNYYRQRLSMPITNYNLRMCLERGMWHRVNQICQRMEESGRIPNDYLGTPRTLNNHEVSELRNDVEYQRLVATRPKVNLITVTPKFLAWPAYQGSHGVIVINAGEEKVIVGDKLVVYCAGEEIKAVAELFGRPAEQTFFLRLDVGMSLVEVKVMPKEIVGTYWVKRKVMEDIFEYQPRLFRGDTKGLDGPKHYIDITVLGEMPTEGKGLVEQFLRARAFQQKGDWPNALLIYTQINHPLARQEVASWYRWRGSCALGYMFATAGLRMPHVDLGDIVIQDVTDKLLEDASISAYYVGDMKGGRCYSDQLLQRTNSSQVRMNYCFYLEKIPCELMPIPVQCPPLQGVDGKMRPLNPSICRWREGYVVTCRTVNYDKLPVFRVIDMAGGIRTRNFILEYTDAMKPTGRQLEIIDPKPGCVSNIQGLEDIRIWVWQGNLWVTATEWLTQPVPQMVMCRLAVPDWTQATVTVMEKKLLIGPSGEKASEKNWLPWVCGDALSLIYGHDPFTRLSETGQIISQTKFRSQFKGSAPPIPFDGGWLYLVHEHFIHPSTRERVYGSRFVWISAPEAEPTRMTTAFIFREKGVEFSCGLVQISGGLVAGVAFNDAEAVLAIIDPEWVRRELQEIRTT